MNVLLESAHPLPQQRAPASPPRHRDAVPRPRRAGRGHPVPPARRRAARAPRCTTPSRPTPTPTLLAALAAAGSRFDVASPAEVVAALEAGAPPSTWSTPTPSSGATTSRSPTGWACGCSSSTRSRRRRRWPAAAPGSSVLCRIVTSGEGSDWSLSRKYGCSPDQAAHILRSAAAVGLDPAGISFHVGSQQRDTAAWDGPIAASARVFASLRADGLEPWLLDLGGGFPAHLEGGCLPPRVVRRRHRARAAPPLR